MNYRSVFGKTVYKLNSNCASMFPHLGMSRRVEISKKQTKKKE